MGRASGRARCVSTAVVTSDLLRRAAIEFVVALLTSCERTSLLLEVLHVHGWELGRRMVLRSVVVDLVDWYGRVNDVRLYGLLLDDRLDSLMHVMVHMLASNGRLDGAGSVALDVCTLITVLALLLSQTTLNVFVVVVLKGPMLGGLEVVMMLLG